MSMCKLVRISHIVTGEVRRNGTRNGSGKDHAMKKSVRHAKKARPAAEKALLTVGLTAGIMVAGSGVPAFARTVPVPPSTSRAYHDSTTTASATYSGTGDQVTARAFHNSAATSTAVGQGNHIWSAAGNGSTAKDAANGKGNSSSADATNGGPAQNTA